MATLKHSEKQLAETAIQSITPDGYADVGHPDNDDDDHRYDDPSPRVKVNPGTRTG